VEGYLLGCVRPSSLTGEIVLRQTRSTDQLYAALQAEEDWMIRTFGTPWVEPPSPSCSRSFQPLEIGQVPTRGDCNIRHSSAVAVALEVVDFAEAPPECVGRWHRPDMRRPLDWLLGDADVSTLPGGQIEKPKALRDMKVLIVDDNRKKKKQVPTTIGLGDHPKTGHL
jgi:hypothetical protein